MDSYTLIDSGHLKKLEQFGPVRLIRPCPFAIWSPKREQKLWEGAEAEFTRETENRWERSNPQIATWPVTHGGFHFKIALTEFGNVGLFPEHQLHWDWMKQLIEKRVATAKRQQFVLNLFAYTGGATFACSQAGACVCHLDASKTAVSWARENAALNHMVSSPIRWIVDDATEFAKRELRRNRKYDGIILDPPSFGRGPNGEMFKLEQHLPQLLDICINLLSEAPLFLLLTCHTPGFNATVLHHLMTQKLHALKGTLETGEMMLSSPESFALPSGSFARWSS